MGFYRRGRYGHLIRPFTENAEQQKVVNHLRIRYPQVLFTTGLLGIRIPDWARWLLRALGYADGTPDIMVFQPNFWFHGLFIEMKRPEYDLSEGGNKKIIPAGVATRDQKCFLGRLRNLGYRAEVCYGSDSAIRLIDEYMAMKDEEIK